MVLLTFDYISWTEENSGPGLETVLPHLVGLAALQEVCSLPGQGWGGRWVALWHPGQATQHVSTGTWGDTREPSAARTEDQSGGQTLKGRLFANGEPEPGPDGSLCIYRERLHTPYCLVVFAGWGWIQEMKEEMPENGFVRECSPALAPWAVLGSLASVPMGVTLSLPSMAGA